MGLFSARTKLTPDEILARMDAIEAKLGQQQYKEAFADATALEKEAKNYGAYHLGVMYHLGWGVAVDYDKALNYYNAATVIENRFISFVWYMGGLLYLHKLDKPDNAAEWLEKAEALGYPDAPLWLANAWFRSAMKFREYARRTLRMDECTQANYLATRNAIKAQNKYLEIGEKNPAAVPYDHAVCLGRCVQLLYNLSCRGELSMDVTSDNSFSSWLGNSFKVVGGTMNNELHARMLANATLTCDALDRWGLELVGEYFRAACGLLDAELHHSAEAFYRVRWHMKRIGEIRGRYDYANQVGSLLTDVMESYEKMDKKYGANVVAMMREGKMPDLSASYLDGKVPDPESCQNFMDLVQQVRSAPATSTNSGKKEKKGLLGFLRR